MLNCSGSVISSNRAIMVCTDRYISNRCIYSFPGRDVYSQLSCQWVSVSLLRVALRMFLKRNLLSVFLPAGGFSSLAFFTGEVESRGASKSQIHLASTFFAFFSILSVVVVAFPVFGFALIRYKLGKIVIIAFLFLIILIASFFIILYSLARKGKAYKWLSRIRPSIGITLDEMIGQNIDRKQLWITLIDLNWHRDNWNCSFIHCNACIGFQCFMACCLYRIYNNGFDSDSLSISEGTWSN